MKRRRFELRWDDVSEQWYLAERDGKNEFSVQWYKGLTKHLAEARARQFVRRHAPSQLYIFTKKGRIGKGGRSEATYLLDPVRSRG